MASVFPKVIGEGPEGVSEAKAAPPGKAVPRTDRAVRAIVRNWRILTGGSGGDGGEGRTLIACSGGADSCALVAALGTLPRATDKFVVGNVVHDLRAEVEALGDRDVARGLARRLGLEFVEARVRCREPAGGSGGRNLEAVAREARYAALAGMARERGIRFIATAHHADDQLETVVMSLLRGAAGGGAGVRGMAAKRRMSDVGCRMSDVEGKESVLWLIRPMLTDDGAVDRAACRRMCELAGVEWREDATNSDTSRLRAAVRYRVAPVLRELRPDVGRRAMAAAAHAEAASKRLEAAARKVIQRGKGEGGRGKEERVEAEFVWPRAELRQRDGLVLGAAIRLARRRLCGRVGEDRVSKRAVDAAVRAIRDESTEIRRCVVGGMEVEVTARRVVMTRRTVRQ